MACALVSCEGAAFCEKASSVVARNSGFGRDVFPSRTGSRCSVLASLVTGVAGARDFAFATVAPRFASGRRALNGLALRRARTERPP